MTGSGTCTADAVVVGGGVNGAGVAYHLSALGTGRVVVLDTASPRSATPKSAAVVSCHYPTEAESALARAGLRELREVPARTGGDTGFVPTGVVHLVAARYRDMVRRNVGAGRAAGLAVELLSPSDLAALYPGGDFTGVDDEAVVIAEPEAGYADPARTTRAYLDAARRAGVRVGRSRVRRVLTESGRVSGVETEAGRISAPVVVLAAGVWTDGLLRDLGIDLGLSPRRVQVVRFRAEPAALPAGPVLLDQLRGWWVRPDGADTVLTGVETGIPVVGPSDGDEGVDQWYVELCRSRLADRFPAMAGAAMHGGWAGLVTMSRHGRPVIDHLPEAEGLYCVAGDSGTSFKTAPAVTRAVAEWITDGSPACADLTPFGRTRQSVPPSPHAAPAADGYGRLAAAARLAREIRGLRESLRSTPQKG